MYIGPNTLRFSAFATLVLSVTIFFSPKYPFSERPSSYTIVRTMLLLGAEGHGSPCGLEAVGSSMIWRTCPARMPRFHSSSLRIALFRIAPRL